MDASNVFLDPENPLRGDYINFQGACPYILDAIRKIGILGTIPKIPGFCKMWNFPPKSKLPVILEYTGRMALKLIQITRRGFLGPLNTMEILKIRYF